MAKTDGNKDYVYYDDTYYTRPAPKPPEPPEEGGRYEFKGWTKTQGSTERYLSASEEFNPLNSFSHTPDFSLYPIWHYEPPPPPEEDNKDKE